MATPAAVLPAGHAGGEVAPVDRAVRLVDAFCRRVLVYKYEVYKLNCVRLLIYGVIHPTQPST